jgi:glycerol-3-phosphate acyltransferase PlsX
MRRYKIALDVMGSDKGAEVMVRGAGAALDKNEDLELLLVGDEKELISACESCAVPMERVEILHADEVITNYDSPATAIFQKTNSSLVLALRAAAEREDIVGVVNAGSTGALIAGSVRFLSREDRVRPALAVNFPAENGSNVCLVDAGATIDCGASTLLHFAKLGTEFMRDTYNIENPKVGLLSNGAEPTKGNKLVKEAHAMFAECKEINFIGNVEGNNALSGICDVLVCDGFAGNQVLKVTEGTTKRIITDIVKIAKKSGKQEYMALVGELMALYGMDSLGGGIILGAKKPIVKAHGAADETAVVNTLGIVLSIAKNKENR